MRYALAFILIFFADYIIVDDETVL